MRAHVELRSSHLLLDSDLVTRIFGDIHYAYAAYVAAQQALLLTPVSSQWFVKMHSPAQFLLKDRNLNGDKSLAVREIFIDNELDERDRILEVEVVDRTQLIKVKL